MNNPGKKICCDFKPPGGPGGNLKFSSHVPQTGINFCYCFVFRFVTYNFLYCSIGIKRCKTDYDCPAGWLYKCCMGFCRHFMHPSCPIHTTTEYPDYSTTEYPDYSTTEYPDYTIDPST